MAVIKIKPKRQITIPKEIFEKLHLEVGDFIEAKAEDEKIIMIPQKLTPIEGVIPLSEEEQKILMIAKAEIDQIKKDIINSKGLTKEEVEVAVKVGLIPKDQAWWWTEEWQEGEREAEKEIREGKLEGPFETFEDFKASLK